MRCPFCKHEDSKVLDSRDTSDDEIRRRRECLSCEKRFTTYERVEMADIYVIKKDGKRELYDRDKIRRGVMKACEKRDIDIEKIDSLVGSIETEIRGKEGNEVTSKRIGSIVMKYLKKLDNVAYIRFASVYREFTDLESFEEELQMLLKKHRKV